MMDPLVSKSLWLASYELFNLLNTKSFVYDIRTKEQFESDLLYTKIYSKKF